MAPMGPFPSELKPQVFGEEEAHRQESLSHVTPFSTSPGSVFCPRDAAKMTATGIAVGVNKGHVVTKRDLKQKPSYRKGVSIIALFSTIWCS